MRPGIWHDGAAENESAEQATPRPKPIVMSCFVGFVPKGTETALHWAKRVASFVSASGTSSSSLRPPGFPDISPEACGRFHVLLVSPPSDEAVEQENDLIMKDPTKRWTKGYLKDALGYYVLTESTLVIDYHTGRVLFACVTGSDIDDAAREHERLNIMLNKSYEAFRLRNTSNLRLVMHGMRHSKIPNRDKQFGFYRKLNNKFNSDPENQRATTAVVARVTSAMSSVERGVSPLVHAQRVHIARKTGASGRCSAVAPELLTLDQCPAFALGCSVGYVSHPHRDDSAFNVPETVLFARPRHMPSAAGWCFASLTSRVVVDLQANPATFVMVPARELHGTPHIMTPNKDHGGIGVVITNKGNLLRGDAAFRKNVKNMWKEAENRFVPRPKETKTTPLSNRIRMRVDRLRSRLRCSSRGTVPRRLLDGWTLSPLPADGRRQEKASYKYSHPVVGTFTSLTKAKTATLSLCPRQ